MPPDPVARDGITGRPSTASSQSPSPSPPLTTGNVASAIDPTTPPEHINDPIAVVSRVKSASPATATRPKLFSRFSLPPLQLGLSLRGKNRNIADFHIRCDEPHKNYSAGDSVRGAVVLAVIKPLRITHLVVTLHGYVRVFKDPTSVAKAQNVTTIPPSGSSWRAQYQGNGLTSLFQDEQVLSGEGRIEPGKYEFGFDLMFPNKALPSSIDFERGTISYTITATLTRPTTIAPTTTCDRKVTLLQQIDVGLLSPPRPRTIFLEPISKRTRRKKSTVSDKLPGPTAQEFNDAASEADSSVITEDSVRGERNSHSPSEARAGTAPSDVLSQVSGESGHSVSTTSRHEFTQLSHVGSTLTSAVKQQAVDDKTITATIELLKGGCLPGEAVTVRVNVQHVKNFKSMTGVIVTLFRQSRIDTTPPPASALEGSELSRRSYKEDPYPKSRTGLAGLSLSSTSSTSVFRKDLDQSAAPLIVDPITLQASITLSVRIPDDAFPTIKGVPGDIIWFKYQAEVIVDLGGRLTAQLGGGASTSRFGGNATGEQPQIFFGPQRGSNIADTTQVKGQKGIIYVSLETVVGTVDSGKSRQSAKPAPRQRTIRIADANENEIIQPESFGQNGRQPQPQGSILTNGYSHAGPSNGEPDYTMPPPHPADAQQPVWAAPSSLQTAAITAPTYIPSPQIPDPANMTEKDRIRQAETRLLPSQPPAGPSTLGDHDDIYDAEDTPRLPPSGAMVPSVAEVEAGPTASAAEDGPHGRQIEDKQELERRRLLQEASAPPDFPEDMERPSGSLPTTAIADASNEPTAPSLDGDEADEYRGYGVGAGSSRANGGLEQLPAYQR